MLFIPYKFDLKLSRIPFLTILVCLVCVGIYSQKYANASEFEKRSLYYCSANLSTI